MRFSAKPVQFIATPTGDRLVVLPEADYVRMIDALEGRIAVEPTTRNNSGEAIQNLHYTAPEVAARLRVEEITLARWRSTGKGPRYIKSGGRVLYREADLLEYENKNERKGTRPDN